MESQIKLWTFIEVLATITLMAGVGLTSLNIYPANIYVSLVGNFLWFLMGWYWKKWSLILIQSVVTVMYIIGIIKYLFVINFSDVLNLL